MTRRDISVSIRLSQYHHIAVQDAAKTTGLRVGEWLRFILRRHLSGEDSTRVDLLQSAVAVRALLLNVLLFLGPAKKVLTPGRLAELWKQIDAGSAAKTAKLLAQPTAPVGTHQSSVQLSTSLASGEYDDATRRAQAKGITVAEFLREVVLTQLGDDNLSILHQHLQNIRMILDEAIRHLTGTGELPRDVVMDLAARTSVGASVGAESPDQES